MSKRILSLVLALVMVLGTMGSLVFAEGTGNEKVDELIELGLVQGYGDGTYGLDKTITRAEVATMLVRALDAENEAKAMANIPSIFTDMSPLQWANGYVNYAVGKGIITGYPDKTFRPNNDITYAEVAKMLVEILDGLTDAEKASAVWPTTWLAKAAQLGVFDGVNINDYSAKAVREKVFEMVYNVYINKEIGGNEVIKAIVLENYRVEKLGKNEIVVEVIRELQASQYPEVSRKEQGDQLKLTIDAKVGDVEDMLGKVYDFTLNREGKVIKAQLDTSYEYKQGKVAGSQISRTKFAGYTVLVGERYNKDDERVFKAVLNNEAGSYTDMYGALDGAGIDFARYTVKNGKVLYIDAFNFDDIAPVAKVTDKGEVLYFDDYKDGEVDELDEADYVLVYEDGKLTRGEFDEIDVNDVLHWFVSNKKLTVVVRPEADNKVEGEYKEAYAAKAKDEKDLYIVVDDEDYPVVLTQKKAPVYSYTMEIEDFFALTNNYDEELEDFEDTDVVVLRDIFGNVQLIGTDISEENFYAVVTDTSRSRGEIKLLRTDGENVWYETDRNTKYEGVSGDTQDKKFDKFYKNDFVKVQANEDNLITRIEKIDYKLGKVERIDKDVIEISYEGKEDENYYVSRNAILFVNYSKVMDVAKFLKDYKKEGLKGAVVVVSDRDDSVARIIILDNAKLDSDYDELVVKVNNVRFKGGKYSLDVIYGDGTRGTHDVSSGYKPGTGELDVTEVKRGDFVIIEVTDDDAKVITSIKEVDWSVAPNAAREVDRYSRSTDRREGFIEFKTGDPERIRIAAGADVFGDPKEGDYVAYRFKDADNYVADIVAVVPEPEEPTPEPEPEEPETYVYGGITTIGGTKYVILNGTPYRCVDEISLDGLNKGDTVVVTFIDVDGQKVVLTIEKYEPEEPDPEVIIATSKGIIEGVIEITIVSTTVENASKFQVYYVATKDGETRSSTEPDDGPDPFNEPVTIPELLIGKEVTIKLYNANDEHLGDYTVIVPDVKE